MKRLELRCWHPFEDFMIDPGLPPGPFKSAKKRECRKIAAMSIYELYDFIDYEIEPAPPNTMTPGMQMEHYMLMWMFGPRPFGVSELEAAAKYKNTVLSILMYLQRRLEGELKITEDIKNVREVMNGHISTPDYTALSLIHERMIQTSEIRVPKIRQYLSRLARFIPEMRRNFESNEARFDTPYTRERRREYSGTFGYEAQNRRSQRKRRAPDRLNIASKKSKSYV